jgi:L-ascorbate metabolism protein UlaG (beta-lactamase superfamily)
MKLLIRLKEGEMSKQKKSLVTAMITVCVSAILTVAKTSESPIEVTYIANEGILIATHDKKVLIDALFDNPNPNYAAPSKDMLEGMQSGRAPFDNVDLVLVTHNHPDHFSPSFAARFIKNNPNALLMAAADAVDALKESVKDWEYVQDRVFSFELKPGETAEKSVNGISVRLFRTLHSGDLESPQNLMYLIKMNGRTIFHEGDSDGKLSTFKNFGFDKEKIDLALVHFWFPLNPEGERIILEVLKPGHVGLIHLPKRLEPDAPSKIDMIKSHYEDIFLFIKQGEKKIIRNYP